MMKRSLLLLILCIALSATCYAANTRKPLFRVLALYESKGHHTAYSKAAKRWLNLIARHDNFRVDYIQNTNSINDEKLNNYQLIIQLDYPPYGWGSAAEKAFIKYITEGRGGWIGFHHATLLGEFDGFEMWQWFHEFMGGIRFKNYIATFASATVRIEQPQHPVVQDIPRNFNVENEEWYTYDVSPRPNVSVLASVDESTYQPASTIKMGDHPVIWTNSHYKARNIYIFMGHSPLLFDNKTYKRLFSNAVFWAAGQR